VKRDLVKKMSQQTEAGKAPESTAPAKGILQLIGESFGPAVRTLSQPETLAQLPRLFQEGFGPVRRLFVQAHNMREILRRLRDGEQITFVTSFPRSGNTWMRFLLSDVFQQNHGVETATDLKVQPDGIVADFYCDWIARHNQEVSTPGTLVKTHDVYDVLRRRFVGGGLKETKGPFNPAAAFQTCRHLYLFRPPEDSLVSLFHLTSDPWRLYLRRKCVNHDGTGMGIDAFCLETLQGWISHASGYLAAAEEGIPLWFISYDQLREDTPAILGEILHWLGVPHTSATVNRAAANMAFNNLQAFEAKTLGGRTPLFRRGRDGSGRMDLKPETLQQIRERTGDLLDRLRERVERQRGRNQGLPQKASGVKAGKSQPA
jgi:hypothetical protein